jgi:hypothetical protein
MVGALYYGVAMAKLPSKTTTPISGLEPPIDRSNETLREIINDLLPLFKTANHFLLGALIIVFLFDVYAILTGIIKPSDRIVDRTVLIAFISATAAEISVIIIASIRKIK